MQGWNSRHGVFEELILRIRPSLIIEIGTWKGASAIHMATIAQRAGCRTEVLCIDTFLGWTRADLPKVNGFPVLYWQFLANVVHCGADDRITPYPQTSTLAAAWLRQEAVLADMIYVDASHSFEDVFDDLFHYWPLLRVGGALFGDDYTLPGVREAVDLFALLCGHTVRTQEEKWIIEKNSSKQPRSAHSYLRLATEAEV